MVTRTTVTVDGRRLAEWRVAKAEMERDASQTLSWTQFFDRVVEAYKESVGVPVTAMGTAT